MNYIEMPSAGLPVKGGMFGLAYMMEMVGLITGKSYLWDTMEQFHNA